MTTIRKKLIEHSLPLDAINAACRREKSVRHGHPSTLHLWWARRPLAACRAVIFAQLVDDPSAWPDKFETEEDQDRERRRLHGVIENMVEWPKSDAKDQARFKSAIEAARWEIVRSVAWGRGEEPPARSETKAVLAYLQEYAPPVYDPFCGGGSIPLEAQRLGLRSYASDLNPVPTLVTKALLEFPPRFSGLGSIAAGTQASDLLAQKDGHAGLVSDVRYFGREVLDRLRARIGDDYPEADLPGGGKATVIAWIWARTVRSPDPSTNGAKVPLASSFVLNDKKGREAIAVPVLDQNSTDGWRFEVKSSGVSAAELAQARKGTVDRAGGGTCILSGAAMPFNYIREVAKTDGLGQRLMAIAVEHGRGKRFLSPNDLEVPDVASLEGEHPEVFVRLPNNARDFKTPNYGMATFAQQFNGRQLRALLALSDTIAAIHPEILSVAIASDQFSGRDNDRSLDEGGDGARAYADAIVSYLTLVLGRCANYWSSLTPWGGDFIVQTFGRQALKMVWDYAEANPFSGSTGNFAGALEWTAKALAMAAPGHGIGEVRMQSAEEAAEFVSDVCLSTDPPYYDNISYADLSDYFYLWHRRTLKSVLPSLYRRATTDKTRELIAEPYRHGGRGRAEAFFLEGMSRALTSLGKVTDNATPQAIYYAFKQSEVREDGLLSPGWATFLQAVVDAGLQVDGTWPIRTERERGLKSGQNVLASSVILVCRKRAGDERIGRREFLRELRPAMQQAILEHQKAGIPLPDRRQAAIGPGIGVFSKYTLVRESDDSPMSVATALALINREIDAILAEGTEDLDAETRFALEWYQQFGYALQKGKAGDAIQQLQGFNLDINSINASGLFRAQHGDAKLLSRGEMEDGWTPSKDATFTLWEMAPHLARALTAEDGGLAKCGQLLAEKPTAAADVLLIAERMFEMATTRGENDEALVWNQLQTSWPGIETAADEAAERGYSPAPEQADLL